MLAFIKEYGTEPQMDTSTLPYHYLLVLDKEAEKKARLKLR